MKAAGSQIVVFKLDNDLFGIDILEVREIIKPLDTTSIPQTPQWVEGVVKLREKVIPIVDLGKYFKLAEDGSEQKRTLVVEIADTLIGLNVDSVEGIYQVSADNIDKTPDIITKDYIKGIVKKDDQLIVFLDITNLLTLKDVEELKDTIKEIKERVNLNTTAEEVDKK